MKSLTTLSAVLLAGCVTTTSELRQSTPIVVDSPHSEAELVQCFVESINRAGTPVVIPHSISFRYESSTTLIIDMEPQGAGTRATFRRLTFRGIPRQARRCL